MNISNNITAPCLLIFAMLAIILFQGVIFNNDSVIFNESIASNDSAEFAEPVDSGESYDNTGKYIVYNNTKYIPDKFFILTIISHTVVFVLPAVFYVKLKGAGYAKKLKLTLPRPGYISLMIYMFFMLITGTILINSFIYYSEGFGKAVEGAGSVLSVSVVDTGGNPVYNLGVLVSFIFLPAICEEFMFRSVLSAEYEKYGALCAALMTSAAFAVSHFSLILFPSYFFAAIIFYSLAKVTNCVVFPVIIHAGYNFYNIYIWDKLAGVLKFEQNRFIFIFLTAVVFMIFIYLVFSRLERIYYKKAYMPDEYDNYDNTGKYGKSNKSGSYRKQKRNVKNNKDGKGYKDNEMNFFIKFSRSFFSPTFIAAVIIFFIYIYAA